MNTDTKNLGLPSLKGVDHQQLTAAATAFEQWRNNRVHTRGKTPEALQQQVVALLPHYSTSTLKKALKISSSNMKRWSQQPQATSYQR